MKKFLKIFFTGFLSVLLAAVIVLAANTFWYYPHYKDNKSVAQINAENTESIKMMSYNLRCISPTDFGKKSWFYRADLIVDDIENEKPGIIGFQEATKWHYSYLQETFPQYDSVITYRDEAFNSEGCPIFYNKSLYTLVDKGSFWLSETPEEPSFGWDAACRRTATWALMKDKRNGKQFYFVNTHLDHKGVEARKNGLKMVLDRIATMNPDGYPMVLTGDFNVTPDDECLVDLDKRMESARKIATVTDTKSSFNGWGKFTPEDSYLIDYIYVSGFKAVPEFRTVTETYAGKPYISDHYPIVSVLEY